MNTGFDVIVVGVGAMGSAACCELARRGARVLGLEQFDVPHARGSSHGFSRMIRMCYYEHPDYVPLLRRAYELWRRLEDESGRKLLHVTGGVYAGRAGGELVTGSRESAERHGLDHEMLTRAQLAERFPQFELPDDYVALYEPLAGWLPPEKVVVTFAELALRRGAVVHANEPVRAWSADASSVTVTTDRATYRASKLIFCGGPWSASLVRDLGVELLVTRQVMTWLWPRVPEMFAPGVLPVWAVGHEDGTLHYGFPMSADGDGVGLKLAHHARGPVTNPDHVARETTEDDERSVRDFIKRFMPRADGPALASRVCLYTNTPDSHFVIDRHPSYADRVFVACGFSGHGFKFASVVGEALADLALEGSSALPIEFLSLSRFGSDIPPVRGQQS